MRSPAHCYNLQDQARTVEAQGGTTADALLHSLAQNLAERCVAVRRLIQAKVGAELVESPAFVQQA